MRPSPPKRGEPMSMPTPGAQPSPTPAPGTKSTPWFSSTGLVVILALLVGGGGTYAYLTMRPTPEDKPADLLAGLHVTEAASKLDEAFTDADGDMIADAP